MANNEYFSRIIHKHDLEENWIKAATNSNFIPKQGEIIVYDRDENYNYERIKMGDGITNVTNLPFIDNNSYVDASISGKVITLTKGDGTSKTLTTQDTTYSNFVKSGSGAKAGLVPTPSTIAGTTKYLREDGTWVVPPDTNTTYTFTTGDSNGQIKVTPSVGSAQNVSVKGLGSAAYTASTAYATTAQGTKADNAMPKSGGTFTGKVTHNAFTDFNYSTYMKNGVFYNAYDTAGTGCCIVGLSEGDDLCLGTTSYPHPGDTIVQSPNGAVKLRSAGPMNFEANGNNIFFGVQGKTYSDAAYQVLRWGTVNDSYTRGYLRCEKAGVSYLGSSSYQWANVYATNGTIQTSDRNEKKNIEDIDDKYIQLFDLVRPVTYQFIKGDRIHAGFISQEVEEAMEKVGLTAEELAFFCRDIKVVEDKETGEEIPVYDDEGNPVYIYSLRYSEYIAIMAEKIRRLEAKYNDKIEQLEAKIAKLEEKIN